MKERESSAPPTYPELSERARRELAAGDFPTISFETFRELESRINASGQVVESQGCRLDRMSIDFRPYIGDLENRDFRLAIDHSSKEHCNISSLEVYATDSSGMRIGLPFIPESGAIAPTVLNPGSRYTSTVRFSKVFREECGSNTLVTHIEMVINGELRIQREIAWRAMDGNEPPVVALCPGDVVAGTTMTPLVRDTTHDR